MSYFARNNQTFVRTGSSYDPKLVLEWANEWGWEDLETDIMVWEGVMVGYAEFQCTYSFHYGDEAHSCELTSNRPDSLCPFHAGDED